MKSFADIAPDLERQAIELPSWAFGNSGTRFKVFAQPGVPRDARGEDRRRRPGARRHRAGAVGGAAHPVGPRRRLRQARRHADDLGLRLGTINTNTFQDDDYKLGSLVPRRRARPRQGDRAHARVRRHHGRHRQPRPEGLVARRPQLPRARPTSATVRSDSPTRCVRSTPASATTNGSCSSTSSSSRRSTRPTSPTGAPRTSSASRSASARSCASTPATTRPDTNIEFIVTQLLRLGRLGAFDFNSRFYADDDLIVGAADPFQLFRILYEVVRGGGYEPESGVDLHARPVPQHRGEDPRSDPLGAERPGDDGARAAGRSRRARSTPNARATCSARTRC